MQNHHETDPKQQCDRDANDATKSFDAESLLLLLLLLLCLFILSRKPNRQSVYSKGAY